MNNVLSKIDLCADPPIGRQGTQRFDATFSRRLVGGGHGAALTRLGDIKGDGVDLHLLPAVLGIPVAAGDYQIGAETIHG